jgi:hypothetical protein
MQTYQPAKLLRLYVTESDRYQEKALHEAILEKCRELKIAGATVFRGVEGYGETAEIHRAHLLGHHLPIVVQIVDTPDNIERLLPAIEGMLEKGLIAISDVSALRIHK